VLYVDCLPSLLNIRACALTDLRPVLSAMLVPSSDEAVLRKLSSVCRWMRAKIVGMPFEWSFSCGGIPWSLYFEPNPRDVRQWRVFRDGQPLMCAGLERVWRAMQREMSPALGRRHWR
jgi:hypothetical protein